MAEGLPDECPQDNYGKLLHFKGASCAKLREWLEGVEEKEHADRVEKVLALVGSSDAQVVSELLESPVYETIDEQEVLTGGQPSPLWQSIVRDAAEDVAASRDAIIQRPEVGPVLAVAALVAEAEELGGELSSLRSDGGSAKPDLGVRANIDLRTVQNRLDIFFLRNQNHLGVPMRA